MAATRLDHVPALVAIWTAIAALPGWTRATALGPGASTRGRRGPRTRHSRHDSPVRRGTLRHRDRTLPAARASAESGSRGLARDAGARGMRSRRAAPRRERRSRRVIRSSSPTTPSTGTRIDPGSISTRWGSCTRRGVGLFNISAYLLRLDATLLGWPVPALLLVIVALAWQRRGDLWDELVLGLLGALLVGYWYFWGEGRAAGPQIPVYRRTDLPPVHRSLRRRAARANDAPAPSARRNGRGPALDRARVAPAGQRRAAERRVGAGAPYARAARRDAAHRRGDRGAAPGQGARVHRRRMARAIDRSSERARRAAVHGAEDRRVLRRVPDPAAARLRGAHVGPTRRALALRVLGAGSRAARGPGAGHGDRRPALARVEPRDRSRLRSGSGERADRMARTTRATSHATQPTPTGGWAATSCMPATSDSATRCCANGSATAHGTARESSVSMACCERGSSHVALIVAVALANYVRA